MTSFPFLKNLNSQHSGNVGRGKWDYLQDTLRDGAAVFAEWWDAEGTIRISCVKGVTGMMGSLPDLDASAVKDEAAVRNKKEGKDRSTQHLRLQNPGNRFFHSGE